MDEWGAGGWDGDGWDTTGCPGNILHSTLALCSKGFSAWEVLNQKNSVAISVRYPLFKEKNKPSITLAIEVTQKYPWTASPHGDALLDLETPELLHKACLMDMTFSVPPTQ